MESLQLIKLANNQQWNYGISWLDVKNANQANLILSLFADDLSITARKIGSDFWVKWGEGKCDCIPVPPELSEYQNSSSLLTMNVTAVPGITIAPIKLSEPILRLFLDDFLPNPSERYSLHRRSDDRQVAVSEAVGGQILLSGASLEQACRRVRQDYWYLPDLEDFKRDSRQQLEPDNPDSSVIFSYRIHDTTFNNWRQFSSEYRLIRCPLTNEIYEVSLGLDVESIPDPR